VTAVVSAACLPPSPFTDQEESYSNLTRVRAVLDMTAASYRGCLGAIFNAIHNWSDNTQSRLPAYRDRIAHVQIEPGDGGLNLDMPKSLIDTLSVRGARTGCSWERFSGGAPE
jgi:hypothetical protein